MHGAAVREWDSAPVLGRKGNDGVKRARRNQGIGPIPWEVKQAQSGRIW